MITCRDRIAVLDGCGYKNGSLNVCQSLVHSYNSVWDSLNPLSLSAQGICNQMLWYGMV